MVWPRESGRMPAVGSGGDRLAGQWATEISESGRTESGGAVKPSLPFVSGRLFFAIAPLDPLPLAAASAQCRIGPALHLSMATTMGSRRLGANLIARFYSTAAAASPPSAAASGEIGVQDFVKSIKGVEAHADKVAQAIIGVPTLLQTRSSRLKKLGIPCKQRKMILRYTEKYRQGIWTPRMSAKQ